MSSQSCTVCPNVSARLSAILRASYVQSRHADVLPGQPVILEAGRLEEAATAATGRDMTREGVMAVLVGRNTRFLIKRPSIIIGRSHAHSEKVHSSRLSPFTVACFAR